MLIILFIQNNLLLLQYTCYSDVTAMIQMWFKCMIQLILSLVLKLFRSEYLRKSILLILISILRIKRRVKRNRTKLNQMNIADDWIHRLDFGPKINEQWVNCEMTRYRATVINFLDLDIRDGYDGFWRSNASKLRDNSCQ